MTSCELVTYVTTIACALVKCYSKDDLEILSSICAQLSDTIETMLTHDEICCKKTE